MNSVHTIEVTAENFQAGVVEQSMQVPVLLDFWADWCQPCKVLGPTLEKLADDYGGSFMLGKVNAEAEYEIAAAFQVRNIPFVVLIDQGRPVDGFTGALGEAEVRKFLKRAGIEPVQKLEPTVAADSPAGRLAQAVAAVRKGDAAAARQVLEGFPADDPVADVADRLRDGLAWLETTPPAGPAGEPLAKARPLFLAGKMAEALELMLESVGHDKAFAEGLARRAMLMVFAVLGEDHDLSDEYRRRLTTLLY